jgi:hypothetical protein
MVRQDLVDDPLDPLDVVRLRAPVVNRDREHLALDHVPFDDGEALPTVQRLASSTIVARMSTARIARL